MHPDAFYQDFSQKNKEAANDRSFFRTSLQSCVIRCSPYSFYAISNKEEDLLQEEVFLYRYAICCAIWASFSRIGSCCGQTPSHLPQPTHAPARSCSFMSFQTARRLRSL